MHEEEEVELDDTDRTILRLAAEGKTNQQIAQEVQEGEWAVDLTFHLLLKDFGVATKEELLEEAKKRRLLE